MQIEARFKPTGAAATLPPKPNFKAEDTLDTDAGARVQVHSGHLRGARLQPVEAHDDVLQLADAVMDAGGLYQQGQPERGAAALAGGRAAGSRRLRLDSG